MAINFIRRKYYFIKVFTDSWISSNEVSMELLKKGTDNEIFSGYNFKLTYLGRGLENLLRRSI